MNPRLPKAIATMIIIPLNFMIITLRRKVTIAKFEISLPIYVAPRQTV